MKPKKLDHERRLRLLSAIAVGLLILSVGLTIWSPSSLFIGCVIMTAVSTGWTLSIWRIVRHGNRIAARGERSDVN